MEEALLKSIDSKLGALLALAVDARLRQVEQKAALDSLDGLLSDAGLTTGEIARLLGKTQGAVQKALQRRGKTKRR